MGSAMRVSCTGASLAWIVASFVGSTVACSTPIGGRASGDASLPPAIDAPDAESIVPVPPRDAGRDAASDAGADAGFDAGADAGFDAGEVDAGPLRGFLGEPIRFRVPGGPGLPAFGTRASSSGDYAWTLVDIDGDLALDLVQTGARAASGRLSVLVDASGEYWRVFRGTAAGFATPAVRFAVPVAGVPEGFSVASAEDGGAAWALVDLDADRRPELVQTADARRSDGAVWTDAVGAYWRVFKNTPGGFSAAAARFPVPSSGTSLGFASVTASTGALRWSVTDLDGDGVVDLVQTANPATAGGAVYTDGAGPFWRRYRGIAGVAAGVTIGFESTSERFTVPSSGTTDGFFATAYGAPAPNTRFWLTRDLTGDGRPDLVQTADPSVNGGFAWSDSQGQFWRVFRGELSGFASVGVAWRVPSSGLADGFFAPNTEASSSPRQWSLADLEGDGELEIVQTADPSKSAATVFRDARGPYWRVFRMRAGYTPSSPERIAVPESSTASGFFAANVDDGPLGPRAWFLLDLNGDGRLDLVQTADPARSALPEVEPRTFVDGSGSYWRVWLAK
jgi:hypothetical protein